MIVFSLINPVTSSRSQKHADNVFNASHFFIENFKIKKNPPFMGAMRQGSVYWNLYIGPKPPFYDWKPNFKLDQNQADCKLFELCCCQQRYVML